MRPRVKSSLMGTSARQKLLQFKLAAHKNSDFLQAKDKAAAQETIEELNKVTKESVEIQKNITSKPL